MQGGAGPTSAAIRSIRTDLAWGNWLRPLRWTGANLMRVGSKATAGRCWKNRPLRHLLGKSLHFGKIEESLLSGQCVAVSVSAFGYHVSGVECASIRAMSGIYCPGTAPPCRVLQTPLGLRSSDGPHSAIPLLFRLCSSTASGLANGAVRQRDLSVRRLHSGADRRCWVVRGSLDNFWPMIGRWAGAGRRLRSAFPPTLAQIAGTAPIALCR